MSQNTIKKKPAFLLQNVFLFSGFFIGCFFLLQFLRSVLNSLPVLQNQSEVFSLGSILFLLFCVLHFSLAILVLFSADINLIHYRLLKNWRYTLQRICGVLVFVFFAMTLWQTNFLLTPQRLVLLQSGFAGYQNFLWHAGLVASFFYFSFGFWQLLIDVGVTANAFSQKITFIFSSVLFFILSFISIIF